MGVTGSQFIERAFATHARRGIAFVRDLIKRWISSLTGVRST